MKRWIALMLTSATVVVAIGGGRAVPNASPVAAQQEAAPPNATPVTEQPRGEIITEAATERALGGTTYWAVVNAAGNVPRHRGAVRGGRLATGQYEVIFLDNIAGCAFTATIGLASSGGISPNGEITVLGRGNDVRGVFVETFTSAGIRADRGFHLVVNC